MLKQNEFRTIVVNAGLAYGVALMSIILADMTEFDKKLGFEIEM